MRSLLLPISDNCPRKKNCDMCNALGYLSPAYNKLDVQEILKVVDCSPTSTVVFPCSSIAQPHYIDLILQLKQERKIIKNIFAYVFWKELDSKIKEKYLNLESGIIFDTLKDLEEINLDQLNYFLIDTQSWIIDTWKRLPEKIIQNVRLFFRPTGHRKSFSIDQVKKICAEVHEFNPLIQFEYPHKHDVLDVRNRKHLNWNFTVQNIFQKNIQQDDISISIIIPFYNRSSFLEKILHFLDRQSLSKKLYEIILVDDGSDKYHQNSLQRTLQNHKNLQIKLTYVEREHSLTKSYTENRAGPVRNLGAHISRGEILLFLDSDIIIPEDYLEKIMIEHSNYDIVLPKRLYLTDAKTQTAFSNIDELTGHTFDPPWYEYINNFYLRNSWKNEDHAWKYFITYCLSLKKKTFLNAGGFRTNFISFGYEDLDLGIRVIQPTTQLKILDTSVYHLYHFKRGYEYTLNSNFRFFQLAMTSRIFYIQNLPLDADYLLEMARLKNIQQKLYFYYYSAFSFIKTHASNCKNKYLSFKSLLYQRLIIGMPSNRH